MALLAEEIVEEWLNRAGYFTIRGARVGVHELDLLAIRPRSRGLECRHIEVQASVTPVSYITNVPREVQKATGRAAGSSTTRSREELIAGVREWCTKKYDLPRKETLRASLVPGSWTRELVLHKIKHPEEVDIIKSEGVTVHWLSAILEELAAGGGLVPKAGGAHLVDLVEIGIGERNGGRHVPDRS